MPAYEDDARDAEQHYNRPAARQTKGRYAVKPRPDYKQEPGYTHMVTDTKTVKAIKFGTEAQCIEWARQINPSEVA